MRLPSSITISAGRAISVAVLFAVLVTALQPGVSLAKETRPSVTLPKGVSAAVTVGKNQGAAPQEYLGIALEMTGLCQFLTTDALDQAEFEATLADLGPIVLKISGKGADYATWKPTGARACSTKGTVVDQAEISAVAAFATRTNDPIIWGLPMIKFNTKAATTEARAVAAILGSHLLGWAPGNEPDLYTGAGMRPKSWTIPQYLAQWKAEKAAVLKAVPTVKFIGPESCCNNTYFEDFARSAGTQVEGLAYHEYAGPRTGMTAPVLLSPKTLAAFASRATYYYKFDSKFAHVPLWLSEVNTFPGGGIRGVSNAYASALWLSDLLFQVELDHVSHVDLQSVAGLNGYDPLSKAGAPRPVFYGMLFYHQAVPTGSSMVLTSTTLAKSVNITSYAIATPTGGLNLILFNKGTAAATVDFNADKVYSSATDYEMAAPSLASVTGVKIGGQSVKEDGTLAAPTVLPVSLHKTVKTSKAPSVSTGTLKLGPSTATVVSLVS